MINFKTHPTLLFTPASKPERFEKAAAVRAHGLIIDLEDGVSEEDKDVARTNAIEYLSKKASNHILNIIRINHITHPAGLSDLLALCEHPIRCDALIYPKSESAHEINVISKILAKQYPNLPIIALIESGKGLREVDSIATDSHNLCGLMFGAADFAVDINSDISMNALTLARMQIIIAASLKKLASYDSPFFDFNDEAGLTQEANYVKAIGFTGKAAIHPKQISIINQCFKPSTEEYSDAQETIKTFNEAKGQACQYKGKMIDVPVYKKAKQIVEMYENLN